MSKTDDCPFVDFGASIVALARRRRAQMPKKFRNSITEGKGVLVGLVGEYCAASFIRSYKFPAEIRDTYDYDIIAGPTKLKLEVKSMDVRSAPRPNNLNPVCIKNAEQQADYYVFMRVMYKDRSNPGLGGRAFFCGAVPCCKLKTWAKLYNKGDIDSNGFPVRFTSYNVAVEKCLQWPTLIKRLQGKVAKELDMGLETETKENGSEGKTLQETNRKRPRTKMQASSTATWDKPPPLLVLK